MLKLYKKHIHLYCYIFNIYNTEHKLSWVDGFKYCKMLQNSESLEHEDLYVTYFEESKALKVLLGSILESTSNYFEIGNNRKIVVIQ